METEREIAYRDTLMRIANENVQSLSVRASQMQQWARTALTVAGWDFLRDQPIDIVGAALAAQRGKPVG